MVQGRQHLVAVYRGIAQLFIAAPLDINMSSFKSFRQYVETRDQVSPEGSNLPSRKSRNGLADPDPGELRQPHKPDSKDLDLAKQAVQLVMGRNEKWNRTIYRFLRRCGEKIPEVGHIVDQMNKPKEYDKLFNTQLGRKDVEPDVLSPSGADSSPSFYQK